MKRTKQKSKFGRNLFVVIVFGLIVYGAYYAYQNDLLSTTYTSEVESESTTVIEDESPVDKEKQRALESIMTREEFQKQQELLAEEIYINEQRDELAARRAQIIADLDAEKAELDAQLEDVRHELVSFGSAPTLNE